jgi:hypothetical protein
MRPRSISPLPDRLARPRKGEPRLPSLFGRLSVLLDSHERQLATFEHLREMCNAIDAGQSSLPATLDPNRLLTELGCELSAHFTNEEGPAHFGTIARTRTDLLPRVVDLKADHSALQRTLARIELIATDKGRRSELPALVSGLLTDLAAHEQAEAELVEEFFSSDQRAAQ